MYAPGDLLVIPLPDGYIIGRILHTKPHGPWWEQLSSAPEYYQAARLARLMAEETGQRAWLYRTAQDIQEIGPNLPAG